MENLIQCFECNYAINSKEVEVMPYKMIVNNTEYIALCYKCPKCNGYNIYSVDNKLTYEIHKETIRAYYKNKRAKKIKSSQLEANVKLRLKLNLLRQSLIKNISNQNYQLFDKDNKLVKTGKFELPNLKSEEENK